MKNEKVLGFLKKDAKYSLGIYWEGKTEIFEFRIPSDKLVPVRLKSESVDLKWLEEYCKEKHQRHTVDLADDIWNFTKGCNKALDDLLSAAKKEADKK